MNDDVEELNRLGLENIPKHKIALGSIPFDGPESATPPGFKIKLFKHQRMILHHMKLHEDRVPTIEHDDYSYSLKCHNASILMEPVGSGKSYTILARIAQQPTLNRKLITINTDHVGGVNQEFGVLTVTRDITGSLNIIVVPHGIVGQWSQYLSNTSIKGFVIKTRSHVIDAAKRTDDVVWIVSSTMYQHLIFHIPRLKVARLIIDECDSIQLSNMTPPQFAFIWFISSSAQNILYPSGVRYRASYSSGILSKGFIQRMIINMKAETSVVKAPYIITRECMNLPEPVVNTLLVKRNAALYALDGFVKDRITSYLNANDLTSLAQYLGVNTVESELDVVNHVINKYNKKRDLLIEHKLKSDSSEFDKKINDMDVAINTIKNRMETQETCLVCLKNRYGDDDPIKNLTVSPCCHAVWCFSCIISALNVDNRCPKCRTKINQGDLTSVLQMNVEANDKLFSDKRQAFISLIRNLKSDNSVHRVLCFAEHDGGLDVIEELCRNENVKFNNIKGTGSSISSKIKSWSSSKKISVLLLNASRFGAGLNLQAGTDIILWHRLSVNVSGRSDMERQVLGRVLRIGVEHTPIVHRIAYVGEYST